MTDPFRQHPPGHESEHDAHWALNASDRIKRAIKTEIGALETELGQAEEYVRRLRFELAAIKGVDEEFQRRGEVAPRVVEDLQRAIGREAAKSVAASAPRAPNAQENAPMPPPVRT